MRPLRTRLVVSAASAAVLVTSLPVPAHAGDASPGSVRAAYDGWVRVLEDAECDGTAVARRYTSDAILLATFTSYVQGRRAITGYFDGLTCKEDLRVSTQRITVARDGAMAYATGLYAFSYTSDDGQRVRVPARFTFVFVARNGSWRIANHHSSQVP